MNLHLENTVRVDLPRHIIFELAPNFVVLSESASAESDTWAHVVGKSILSFVPKSLREDFHIVLNSVVETKSATYFEVKHFTQDDELQWFAFHIEYYHSEFKPIRINAFEISSVKGDLEKAKSSNNLKQSILDNIGDGVIVSNVYGELIMVNPEASRITGINNSKAPLDSWKSYHGMYSMDRTKKLSSEQTPMFHVLQGEELNHLELFLINPINEEGVYVSCTGRPLKDPNGQITGGVIVMRDITESAKYKLELKKANNYLDSFVQAAAHDLRTPMSNVINILGLYDIVGDKEKENLIDKAKVSMGKLEEMLDGLMEIVNSQKNKSHLYTNIKLEDSYLFTYDELNSDLKEINAEIEIDFKVAEIIYSKTYLRSIFQNMLTNAVKYKHVDRDLRVKIRTYTQNQFVVLEFTDNGIGINLERDKDKLFKPFKRLTTKAHGKGIGLHIIKNFVEQNGGKIEVKSKLDIGTSFYVFLKPYNNNETQMSLFNNEEG